MTKRYSVLLFALLLWVVRPASAQTGAAGTTSEGRLPALFKQSVHLQLSNASLAETLAALQKMTHLSFVCDNWPPVKQADMKLNGSVVQALNQIESAFHCSWRLLANTHVVLMARDFTNKQSEFPQVDPPEILHMAQLFVRALSTISPYYAPKQRHALVKNALMLFNPAQLNQLEHKGILFRDMPLGAQRLMKQDLLARMISRPLRRWQQLVYILQHQDQWKLQYVYTPQYSNKVFTNYIYPAEPGGK